MSKILREITFWRGKNTGIEVVAKFICASIQNLKIITLNEAHGAIKNILSGYSLLLTAKYFKLIKTLHFSRLST